MLAKIENLYVKRGRHANPTIDYVSQLSSADFIDDKLIHGTLCQNFLKLALFNNQAACRLVKLLNVSDFLALSIYCLQKVILAQ